MARKPVSESPAGLTFTADRAALAEAVRAVREIAKPNKVIPVLSHVLLTAEPDGELRLTACDMDREASLTIPADVEVPGAATLAGETLADIVGSLPADARVTFRNDPAKGSTSITAGRSRFTAPGFHALDFQRLTVPSYAFKFNIAGSILADLIDKTSFAISTEETRYYLNGIYIHAVEAPDGPRLRLVATDGHRLARIETHRVEGLALDMPGVILPRQTVGILKKLCEAAGDAAVSIEVTLTSVRVEAAKVLLTSKVIDGTFPDYQRVIPANNERPMTAPTAEFAQACKRVGKMSLEKSRSIKLRMEADKVIIALRNTDGGEAFDEVDVQFDGPPLEIGFNGSFLAEMIETIGGDTITLKFGPDASAPVLMIPREGDDCLSVLMPMRIF